MTEEQKNCEYCHFDSHGARLEDYDEPGFMQMKKTTEGYYINAWSGECGERCDVESENINFCPMCGRRLGKED